MISDSQPNLTSSISVTDPRSNNNNASRNYQAVQTLTDNEQQQVRLDTNPAACAAADTSVLSLVHQDANLTQPVIANQ